MDPRDAGQPQPSPSPPPGSPTATAAGNRIVVLLLVALAVVAGVVIASTLRARDQAPSLAAEGEGHTFQLEPYLVDLVRKERSSGARFDQLIAAFRAGRLSEASLKAQVASDVIAPYSASRDALKQLPPMLPEPYKERIASVLAYVDLRGELWFTESRRVTQPGLGDRSLLTEDDVQRLATARAASELDKVVLPVAGQ